MSSPLYLQKYRILTMKIFKTFADRLDERMKELNMRQVDVYSHPVSNQKPGISKSNMYNWLKKGDGASYEKLRLLSRILKVNPDWLIGKTDDKNLDESINIDHTSEIDYIYNYPLLDWGNIDKGVIEMDGSVGVQEVTSNYEGECFGLVVNNESMHPEFRNGEQIIVDRNSLVTNGDFCIVKLIDGSHVLRQYITDGGSKFIKAANKDWPNRLTELTNGMLIIGKIIEARRVYA